MKAPHRETSTRSVASLGDVFGAELAKLAAPPQPDGLPPSRRGVVIDCSRSPAIVRVFAVDARRDLGGD